ncbi:MAG TPA: hypothetical protein VK491_05480 [Gemmatimonadaceae bacterium]|nr:hypothetical protein [Gemmatimonadaceae bacterium]
MQTNLFYAVLFAGVLAFIGCGRSESPAAINQPFTVNGVVVEPDSLNAYLAAHRGFTSRGGEMRCAYSPLGQEGTRVFVSAVCNELVVVDGRLVQGSGMGRAAAFEIEVDSMRAKVVGVEVPEDGNRYAPSIRRIFPQSIWPQIFEATGRDRQRGVALAQHLRAQAEASLRAAPTREVTRSDATLDSAARRVVEFLRGNAASDQIELSDSVTLLVAPEGGGGRATFTREQLRQSSAWQVRSGGRIFSFTPPSGMTKLTTKVGRHFNCNEQSLATKFPRLAQLPHVGTVLAPTNRTSCLQTWNMTFVFDTNSRPRIVAAVYDQWEW